MASVTRDERIDEIGLGFTVDGLREEKRQYEDLNSKSQIPNSKQAPNSKFQFSKRKLLAWNFLCFGHLVIGIWNLFGIWCLGFGI